MKANVILWRLRLNSAHFPVIFPVKVKGIAFPNQTARSFQDIKAWFENGADPNAFLLPELEARLETLSGETASSESCPALLFETPFGRTHHRTGRFIDYLVWIDVPLEIALARQILGFCQRAPVAGPEKNKAFAAWLENFLNSYTEVIADMYRRQAIDVRAGADLVVDGLNTASELAEIILAAIPALAADRPRM